MVFQCTSPLQPTLQSTHQERDPLDTAGVLCQPKRLTRRPLSTETALHHAYARLGPYVASVARLQRCTSPTSALTTALLSHIQHLNPLLEECPHLLDPPPTPPPTAPLAEWHQWCQLFQSSREVLAQQSQLAHTSRRSEARSLYFAQRQRNLANGTLHKTTKTWGRAGNKARPNPFPRLLTTWTTLPADRHHPDCQTTQCLLEPESSAYCLRPGCGARAFVTADPTVLTEQSATYFGSKFAAPATLPNSIVRHHRNRWGERVAFLTSKPRKSATPTERSMFYLHQPPPESTQSHYANVMRDPSLAEFTAFVTSRKGSSAPGPSKFRYNMLKRAAETVIEAMHKIVCICITLQGFPDTLKDALLYPIPKSSGPLVITNLRPITLLEIGYKLTTGWIARELSSLARTAPSPLLHRQQFGSKADSVLMEPLFLFQSVLEDAYEHPTKICGSVLLTWKRPTTPSAPSQKP